MAIFPGSVATDTDLYIAANDLATALTAGINSAVTSIPVVSTAGFPATGFISIDSEIIHYSAIADSTHFTADVRGADGTTAASHLSTTAAYHNVIAAHHNALKDEIKAIEGHISTILGLSTTQLVAPIGSIASPGYSFLGHTSSGLCYDTAGGNDSIALVQAGTRILTTGTSGARTNLGVVGYPLATWLLSGDTGFAILGSGLTLQLNTPTIKFGSSNQTTVAVTAASSAWTVTLPDPGASCDFVLTTKTQTIGGAKTFSSAVAITATSNHLVLSTSSNTLTISAATQATSARTWTIPDVSGNGTFAALEGTQTFSGAKTFSANVSISKASPTLTITDGANTNGSYIRLDTNTSTQQMYVGVDSSAGGNLLSGSSAYAVVIGGSGAYPLQLGTSNAVRLGISSGGDVGITSGKKLLLDGVSAAGDTYFIESAANVISVFTAGTERWIFDGNGNFSANAHGGVIWAGPSNSASFPDHSFYGDTNSGLRSTGADTLALTTGATDGLLMNASASVSIKGTTTNDDASAGFVGEFVESIVANVSGPTSTQIGDLTSISLTAGDWDVWLQVTFVLNSATITSEAMGISTTSGNSGTGLTSGDTYSECPLPVGTSSSTGFLMIRKKLSSTTTVYAKLAPVYSAGTPKYYGSLRARRRR